MNRSRWRVVLSGEADRDFAHILRWTAARFGRAQAQVCKETLKAAIRELSEGPEVLGGNLREEIGAGIRTLHVARHGRRGLYFLMFHVSENDRVDVLRILHDSMDLTRHGPDGRPEASAPGADRPRAGS